MSPEVTPPMPLAREVWVLALWSGMVMGLGEALAFYTWKAFGTAQSVSIDVVWAAMVVDTVLALVVAGLGLLASRVAPGMRAHAPAVFLFLIWMNWTAVAFHDRIHVSAIVLLAGGLTVITRGSLGVHSGGQFGLARRTIVPVAILGVMVGSLAFFSTRLGEEWALRSLPEAEHGAPNVLVLLLDNLRADHMSSYGYLRSTTPRMDDFAAGGTIFDDAYATSSYTLASHASILTGLLPHEHGAEWTREMDYWDCGCEILGTALQADGYATAGFSANPFWFTREYGFARGFHHFEDFFNTLDDVFTRTGYGRAVANVVLPRLGYLDFPGRKDAAFQNGRLLRWLDRRPDRPFFAFVNYFDVHDPYLPPLSYRTRFNDKPVGGIINWRLNGIDPDLPASIIDDEIDAYDGAITYLDEQIGHLFDELAARGILENTIVVITSDHGEEFGEHGGLVLHGHSLYRQAIRVPLVIRGPGVPAGRRVGTPVTNAALPATIASLTIREEAFPMTPLLGAVDRPLDPPIAELTQKPWGSQRHRTLQGATQSIVVGNWHLIRYETFNPELFDLSEDPTEQDDLSADPEAAERLSFLADLLDSYSVLGDRETRR